MKLIVENRFALLGLVALALAALFGVALVTRSDAAPAGGEAEWGRVESALRVCPPAVGGTDTEAVGFTPYGGDEDGDLEVTENRPDGRRLAAGELPGQPVSAEPDADDGRSTALRASGAFAAGLEAAQTSLDDGDDATDLTAVRCPDPGISSWFTAPSGAELEELTAHLANIDGRTAVASVDVYAADGPVIDDGVRGVQVPPHGEEAVELGELTELGSSGRAVAVHVRTNAGRVAAGLYAERDGDGSEWSAATAGPARSQTVGGVPGGGGSRTLVVAAPGDEPATADVRVFTPDGEVEHDALTGLDVPPAASAALSLEGPIDKEPATVVVEADRPVVAGVLSEREGGDDSTSTAAVPPLQPGAAATGVVPSVPEGTKLELLLGAVEQDASVIVTPVADDGTTGDPVRVEAGAGTTAAQEVEGAAGSSVLVEVRDGSGPVHAAAVLTRGKGDGRSTTVLPIHPAPSLVRLPPAVNSLTAVDPAATGRPAG
ncbi:DUF5719 family protein [Nocardiopsis coralliicola]